MALVLLIPAGCISYSGKDLARVTGFPRTEIKPSAEIVYSFHTYLNDKEKPATEFFQESFQKKIMERFNKSGLYSSVSAQDKNADIQVTVEVKHSGHGYLMLAALCGATFYIIPCRVEDEYQVTANVYNRKTKSTSNIQVDDSQVLWMNILLLPAMPFYDSQKALEKKMVDNIMDTFALRVYETTSAKK